MKALHVIIKINWASEKKTKEIFISGVFLWFSLNAWFQAGDELQKTKITLSCWIHKACDVIEEAVILYSVMDLSAFMSCTVRLCPRRGKLLDANGWLMCFLRGNVHSFHCNINFCITALQPLWERVIYNNPSVLDLSKEARGRGRTREARRKDGKLILNSLQ